MAPTNAYMYTKIHVHERRTPMGVISGFCHEVAEKCTLLCYYTASNVNYLQLPLLAA